MRRVADCLQIAFCGVAYPSLVITYFGQAAFLMANPEQVHYTRSFRAICSEMCLICLWACAVLFPRYPALAARCKAHIKLANCVCMPCAAHHASRSLRRNV